MTINKLVNISDNGKASQMPFIPIISGNTMKHGNKKMKPRKTAKVMAGFTRSMLW